MIYKQIKNVQIRSKWLLDLLSLDIRKCVVSQPDYIFCRPPGKTVMRSNFLMKN